MSLHRVCVAFVSTAAIVGFVPRTVNGQINQIFKPAVSDTAACPSRLNPPPSDAEALKKCIDALAVDQGVRANSSGERSAAFPATADEATGQDKSRSIHTTLLKRYAAYLAAQDAVQARPAGARAVFASAQSALDDTAASLHAALQEHGLEETSPIVGELRTGPVITSTGTVAGSTASQSTSSGDVLAHIVWQTAHSHAKDKTNGGDYSFEGQFGLQPALTLLQAQNNTTQLAAQYQQGLVVDVGVDASHFSGDSEWSLAVRTGFVRFGQLAQVIQSNGANYLAVPAGNADQVAPYFEVGVRGSLFDRPMVLVHLAMGTLSTRLMGEAVYRRDTRFSQVADAVKLSNPEDRMVFRFMLDGLNVIDKRTDPESNKIFKVGFGFEYQRGWSDGALPGFSFLIRGDADLLKILQGGHSES